MLLLHTAAISVLSCTAVKMYLYMYASLIRRGTPHRISPRHITSHQFNTVYSMLYNTWQPAKIQHSKSQSFIIYIDSEFTITICKAISNVTYQDTLPQTKIHAGPLIIYDDICSVIQRAVFVTPNILLLYPTQHHCHPRQHTLQSYRGYTAQHCPVCSHQPACCLYTS